MNQPIILLVDDDPDLLDVVETNLQLDGYDVLAASNPRQALGMLANSPEVVILDLMMPEMSGLDLCKEIRKVSDVPILMLTAREAYEDKERSYAMGADDYLTKPFDPRELGLRIGALRKRRALGGNARARAGHLTFIPESNEVKVGNKHVRLSPLEYRICDTFAKRPGEVLGIEQILDAVWGSPDAEEFQVVRVHINNLRRKLEPDPAQPIYIRTIRNVGYQFLPTGEPE